MTLAAFTASVEQHDRPADLAGPLLALWHDARGDWSQAHEVAQDIDDEMGSRIHAYLHRKEGDIGNAGYWYRRAGLAPFKGTLGQEWQSLVSDLCDQ